MYFECLIPLIVLPLLIQGRSTPPTKWPTLTGLPTAIVAHRGHKMFLPEHTLASYTLGAIAGADYVEPDLVLTKDGVLVCFHNLTLKTGTNVGSLPQFSSKMTPSHITSLGAELPGPTSITDDWFIKDFTLSELKQLRVIRYPVGYGILPLEHHFPIPTFQEYLGLVHHLAVQLNRSIGIIPELKAPSWHNSVFNETPHFMENSVLSQLTKWGYGNAKNDRSAACTSPLDAGASMSCGHLILQSFELDTIKYLATVAPNLDRMLLVEGHGQEQKVHLTEVGLKEVAQYATHFACGKDLIYAGIRGDYDKSIIDDSLGGFIPSQELVGRAHGYGMKVGVFTIYDSRQPSGLEGCPVGRRNSSCDPENGEGELFHYFDLGVDAIFVENVGEAREGRLHYQYRVLAQNKDFGGDAF